MKLKSIALGMAGLCAIPTAYAADLPPAPEPVEYVRICDAFGSGFFYIPGTDSCLRIRGRLRTEIRYRHQDSNDPIVLGSGSQISSAGNRAGNPLFMRARGYWGFDHRTSTDVGVVRAFFRGDIDFDTGDSDGTPSLDMDHAFIQIGSLTLGFTDLILQPVFHTYTLDHGFNSVGLDNATVLIQYKYALANGFSLGAVLFDPTTAEGGTTMRTTGRATAGLFAPVAYGGLRIPSVGAAITYEGDIGSAKLTGALQDVRPAAAVSSDHELAWAIGASAEIALPFGNRTKLGVNAAYTQGIIQFLHEDTTNLPTADFAVNATRTQTELSKGWSVGAGFSTEVFARTTFNLTGGYTDINQSFGVIDVNWYDVAGNLQYRLTDALVLTAEAHYRNLSATGVSDSDAISTVLRAQLDF